MKIKYLGTAAAEGIPGIFCDCDLCENARKIGGKEIRTRSQAVIDDTGLLIDFGMDTYLHCLSYGLRMDKINNVIITHSHQDHFYPEELLFRAEGFANVKEKPLNFYGSSKVIEKAKNSLPDEFLNYKGSNSVVFHTISAFKPILIDKYTVTPLLATHDNNEECFIFIIDDGLKKILYGNDTGLFPEKTMQYIKNIKFDLVSFDCTFGGKSEGTNHMGLPDNVEMKKRLIESNCIKEDTIFVVTHFSHNSENTHQQIVEIADQFGFITAFDTLEINC